MLHRASSCRVSRSRFSSGRDLPCAKQRSIKASAMPTLHYFPVRGRGEMLRLAYAYKGIALEEVSVDFNAMKTDLALYPFGQSPRYACGTVNLT